MNDKFTYTPAKGRTPEDQLNGMVSAIAGSAIVHDLLISVSGMLAILTSNREVIAVNDSLLKFLAVQNFDEIIGLRPGEAFKCAYYNAGSDGCGSSNYCENCGAAVSLAIAEAGETSSEKICALKTGDDSIAVNYCFRVKASPINVDGLLLLLLFIQDITDEENANAIGEIFFHDVKNIVQGLVSSAELLTKKNEKSELTKRIQNLTYRMYSEITLFEQMMDIGKKSYIATNTSIDVEQVFVDLKSLFDHLPIASEKTLVIESLLNSDTVFESDYTIVLRIIINMLKNAFEASMPGDLVTISCEVDGENIFFQVRNKAFIPKSIQLRVFQRYFSTKGGRGRGLGTYSMKMLAEKYLNGRVTFKSLEGEGTTFCLTLPAKGQVSLQKNISAL